MRIVVPGPTSRTGLLPLARAQRRGHQIVVFTRRPEARPDSPALAAVVRGDGHDPCRDGKTGRGQRLPGSQ